MSRHSFSTGVFCGFQSTTSSCSSDAWPRTSSQWTTTTPCAPFRPSASPSPASTASWPASRKESLCIQSHPTPCTVPCQSGKYLCLFLYLFIYFLGLTLANGWPLQRVKPDENQSFDHTPGQRPTSTLCLIVERIHACAQWQELTMEDGLGMAVEAFRWLLGALDARIWWWTRRGSGSITWRLTSSSRDREAPGRVKG